jgi:hypothetical protein
LNNDNESDESLSFPLYDKILNYWFPPTEGYDVCPQWTIPGYKNNVDYSISFVIEHQQQPLLLIEVHPPVDFRSDPSRNCAIGRVIVDLDTIGPNNWHTDRLYAISAIGKKWRACYTLKGEGSKGGRFVKGVADVNSLKSGKPACWNPDITSDASWEALQSIVETIKGYVAESGKYFLYLYLLYGFSRRTGRYVILSSDSDSLLSSSFGF